MLGRSALSVRLISRVLLFLSKCNDDDDNWEVQNTGGTLAVTKGLVGQVEGLGGKISGTLYDKNTLSRSFGNIAFGTSWMQIGISGFFFPSL